jgi:prevent-host-death family protein
MSQAAATEVAKNFGEWHERAMREPVVITKHGRESAVLMSAETFHKLLDGHKEVVPGAELDAAVADAITDGEIPEGHRWDSTDEDVSDERRGTFRLPIPDERLNEAVTLLAEGLHPRAIILFGSRARGTNRPDSDYDLLVVSDQLRDYDEVYKPLVGRGIGADVVPCTVETWKRANEDAGGVLRAALDEGVLLYGQS